MTLERPQTKKESPRLGSPGPCLDRRPASWQCMCMHEPVGISLRARERERERYRCAVVSVLRVRVCTENHSTRSPPPPRPVSLQSTSSQDWPIFLGHLTRTPSLGPPSLLQRAGLIQPDHLKHSGLAQAHRAGGRGRGGVGRRHTLLPRARYVLVYCVSSG